MILESLKKPNLLMAAAAAIAAVWVGLAVTHSGGYTVQMVMPSAANLSVRTPVDINGMKVGQISALRVENGQAVVTLSLSGQAGPLHTGTASRVDWISAVGERVLDLYPGPNTNPVIPSGSMFDGPSHQVEVDQVLATLDAPTRDRLKSVLASLDQTVASRPAQLQAAIASASGTVNGLGQVLQAVGSDGPAITTLVGQLRQMTDITSGRSAKVAATVSNLESISAAVATQQAQLSSALAQLPATLATADTTLRKVPQAADATVGLLQDLRPATDKLPGVSADLAPTLVDLRPAVAQLQPLLVAAAQLLGETPTLLNTSDAVLPTATSLLNQLEPAISFLRPYTPEAVGGLDNWGHAFAPYDGAGHTWTGMLAPGINALNESPVPLPSTRLNPAPLPGAPVGQPWIDATGSGIR